MQIEFDLSKDVANQAKHGLSLAEAAHLEWETLWASPDHRYEYGETRVIGYALIGERLHCVIFTDRGTLRRIISLRKANEREVQRYVRYF